MDFDVDCGAFVPSQTRSLKNKISRAATRECLIEKMKLEVKMMRNLYLVAQVDVDIGEAVKKLLSNRNIMLVAKALYDKSPLSSNEFKNILVKRAHM